MNSNTFHKILNYTLVIVIHIFLLTFIKLQTLFFFWLTFILLKQYIKLKFIRFIQNGIIVYLPRHIQVQILQRSLFDILCDLWFIQRPNVLNVLIKPFYLSIKPDHAAEVLQQLNPQLKRKFLTKGIVNLFPTSIRNIILPNRLEQSNIKLCDGEQEQQKQLNSIQKVPRQRRYSLSSGDQNENLIQNKKKRSIIYIKKFQQDDAEQQISTMYQNNKKQIKLQQQVQNNQISQKKEPAVTHKWDRLEIYQKIKKKINEGSKFQNIISTINKIKSILQFKTFSPKNTSYSKLISIFLFFLLIIYLQFKIVKSKEGRKLIKQTIFVVLNTGSFMGIITCFTLLLYKWITTMKQYKQDFENEIKQD